MHVVCGFPQNCVCVTRALAAKSCFIPCSTPHCCRFLIEVEAGYTGKLYHCSAHAADVLRTLHVLCTRGGIWKDTQCSDLGRWLGQIWI